MLTSKRWLLYFCSFIKGSIYQGEVTFVEGDLYMFHVYRTRWRCYVMPLSTVPLARPRCLTSSNLKGMDSSVSTQTVPLTEWVTRWLLLMILKILLDDITRETPCCLPRHQSVKCFLHSPVCWKLLHWAFHITQYLIHHQIWFLHSTCIHCCWMCVCIWFYRCFIFYMMHH